MVQQARAEVSHAWKFPFVQPPFVHVTGLEWTFSSIVRRHIGLSNAVCKLLSRDALKNSRGMFCRKSTIAPGRIAPNPPYVFPCVCITACTPQQPYGPKSQRHLPLAPHVQLKALAIFTTLPRAAPRARQILQFGQGH